MIYKNLIAPLLDRFPPESSETLHHAVRTGLDLTEKNKAIFSVLELLHSQNSVHDPRLRVTLGGKDVDGSVPVTFENFIGVGAGWTKNGEAVNALMKLGFGFVEVGSVLKMAQLGNDRPRQFMVNPKVAINRLGFNSSGMTVVREKLETYKDQKNIKIGINIGLNKDVTESLAPLHYAEVASYLYNYASYFVINVSSPNTKGLRKLQDKEPLTRIVKAVNIGISMVGDKKPIFLKIAPELNEDQIKDVIDVIYEENLAGIVATNTTTNSLIKAKYGQRWEKEAGGLSGADSDFEKLSNEAINIIYSEAQKDKSRKIQIIGVGGVYDFDSALRKFIAGADAVESVTGLRISGLGMANEITRKMLKYMKDKNIESLSNLKN